MNSSSSSSEWSYSYDVFLSFRGEDTRRTFTGHLHAALTQSGLRAFIDDDDLNRGDAISPALLGAIEASRVAIVVLSENYACSRWCLDELAKIMECRRTRRQRVVPVFYNVDPTEVRRQTGSFGKAMERHEERVLVEGIDKVLCWRAALLEVANLSGWDLRNTADGHEAKFIKKIVEEVTLHLNSTYLFVALHPVGIDFRVQDISPLLLVEGSDNSVRMIGIWGMSGVGKTSLSKAIYNQFYHSFEGRSFLANVRESWSQTCHRARLQKQLLFDVLKTKVRIDNVDSGVTVIKKRLRDKRVLIIIDDIDHIDQMYALARARDWFGNGSRIIVTTKDKHLLNIIGVDCVYVVNQLSDMEALELFSWHAFRRSYPDEGFFDLSTRVVAYSNGLPLALEVLGSFLYGRSKSMWIDTLDKLKKIPHEDIYKKLRISYDALTDDDVRDTFLDIACFFVGMDKNYVQLILDGCGFHSEIGINLLLERCFLTITERNKLAMHDLVRDMGREIVREKSPKEPGERSRLWLHDDTIDVLTQNSGSGTIEGLKLTIEGESKSIAIGTNAFREMKRLRLLQLSYVQLKESYEHISKKLRWLSWRGFPLKFIPNNFFLANIVAMSLKYSNLRQVWKDPPQLLEKLKILNASHSHNLTRTPDFSKLPNLTKLILKDCTSLNDVHHSIGHLGKLVSVNLKGCKILGNLPKSFYKIKSLESLILSECSAFCNLDEDLGDLVSLTTLIADNTGITKIPFTIVRLTKLKHLSLCGLKTSPTHDNNYSVPSMLWSWLMPRKTTQEPINLLPPSLKGLNSLTTLHLAGCNLTDSAIPKDIGSLSSLVSLNLENNNFLTLPPSLRGLSKLQTLWLDGCAMLRSLPDLPPSLNSLYASNCTSLEEMANMSNLLSMQTLDLKYCGKLVDVPGLEKLLESMIVLSMDGCNSISAGFKQKTLQEWKSTGLFGVFLPGDDIPDWFTYVDEGNSLYFEVPELVNCKLESLVVCIVYSSSSNHTLDGLVSMEMTSVSVINYTKGQILTRRPITIDVVISPQDSLWQGHFPSQLFKLEQGDQAEIILDFGPQLIVKKIGVNLCWDRDVSRDIIEYYSLFPKEEGDIVLGNDNANCCKSEEEFKPKRVFDSDEAGPSGSSFDEHVLQKD